MRFVLILFSLNIFCQQLTLSDTGVNLEFIKRELSAPYKSQNIVIAGNKYFFKKPTNATLKLSNNETPVNVVTNYNLLEQTFDIFDDNSMYKLLPDKIEKVIFSEKEFDDLTEKLRKSLQEAKDHFAKIN